MQLDQETRAENSEQTELRLWLRLLTCTSLIENKTRQNLRIKYETTLPRFDLMAQLAQEPKGLKMSDLSDRLMVSNGNITAIVGQLEKEELITRITDSNDRRSTLIKLNAKGKRLYTRMAKDQEKWLSEMLSSYNKKNKADLYKLLGDLKQAVVQSKDSL